jgi:nucleotide-binding universal stress UspA family protein
MDLRTLFDPTLLLFTVAVIVVASVGKFLGALLGGRLGGLTGAESLALATGLNARGSTEVIIASIGLSMGVLSNQLYTMIVAMAVVTTMIMPPTLRWMLARVPLREEEAKRLEKEEAEERESVPKMERALVYLDASPNGTLAASLAGMFAARQQVLTTVMEKTGTAGGDDADPGRQLVAQAATLVLDRIPPASDGGTPASPQMSLQELVHAKSADADDAAETEVAKGYSIAFVGIKQPISATASRFDDRLQRLVEAFDGPLAIVLNGAHPAAELGTRLNILVPTGGTPEARLAMEIALALAKASDGVLTALHVFDPLDDAEMLRGRTRRQGLSLLVDARRLGKRSGVSVKGVSVTNSRPEVEIRRAARAGRYDLVVVGTSLRQGETKFLSPRSSALVRSLRSPVLLIAR